MYASAGAVAEEVLQTLRTVVSFGGEHIEAKRCVGYIIGVWHGRGTL